jgi:AbrB family looped-hinge helix DNA binding protein
MSAVLKVQERGQVTLPKDLRDRMNINPGDMLVVTELENGVIQLSRLRKLTFAEVFGDQRQSSVTSAKHVDDAIRLGQDDAADEVVRSFND